MDGCLLIIGILFLLFFFGMILLFFTKMSVTVPPGHIGWDDIRVYQPGTYWPTHEIRFISLRDRIQTYGLDYQGQFVFVMNDPAREYKLKWIIVWRPNPANIQQFDETATSSKITEILKTIPIVDLKKYEQYLGITIVSIETWMPGKDQSANSAIVLGGGVEIPY